MHEDVSGDGNDGRLLPLLVASADPFIYIAAPREPGGRPRGLHEQCPEKTIASFADTARTIRVAGLKTPGSKPDIAADVPPILEAVGIIYHCDQGLGCAWAYTLGAQQQLHTRFLFVEVIQLALDGV